MNAGVSISIAAAITQPRPNTSGRHRNNGAACSVVATASDAVAFALRVNTVGMAEDSATGVVTTQPVISAVRNNEDPAFQRLRRARDAVPRPYRTSLTGLATARRQCDVPEALIVGTRRETLPSALRYRGNWNHNGRCPLSACAAGRRPLVPLGGRHWPTSDEPGTSARVDDGCRVEMPGVVPAACPVDVGCAIGGEGLVTHRSTSRQGLFALFAHAFLSMGRPSNQCRRLTPGGARSHSTTLWLPACDRIGRDRAPSVW